MALAAAFLIALNHVQQDPMGFRPLPPKTEERDRYHRPDVVAMPMSVRLQAFERRQQLLRDSVFQQITWRSVGPEVQGGRVVDIAVAQKAKKKVFVAFATGGLWTTENLGQSWTPIFDNQSSFGIGDFDITPDGKTIWLGSGEANSQRTSYAGTGVFVSRDGGETWKNVGLHESHHIGRVVIDPKNPDTVYVASLGPLYSQGGERGVYRTTDGGKTWTCLLKGDSRTGCKDFVLDPRGNGVMYASMWERDRRAWNMLESGPGSAVYKSTDNGKTWIKMAGLPNGEAMGRAALALAPSRPDTLYVFIDNQGGDDETGDKDEYQPDATLTLNRFRRMTVEAIQKIDERELARFIRPYLPQDSKPDEVAKAVIKGELTKQGLADLMLKRNPAVFDVELNLAEVWRSDNAGRAWVKTRADLGDHGGYYWNDVTVNPKDPMEVYTMGLLLLKSADGGGNWESVGRRNHVDHHALWIDPENPDFMLNGNDGGIYASFDGAQTWSHWNNIPVGQFTTIAVDTKTPYNIYGGLQDNGTLVGPSIYRPGFSDIDSWKAIGGGDGSAVAIDPRGDGDSGYGASQFGAFYFFDQVTGARRGIRPRDVQGEAPLRFNWIAPIIISKFQSDIIYVGSQRVHRSFDQGKTWESISGDLTKDLPNGDVPFSTLTSIAESPFRFGKLYAGADDGSVKFSPDTGLTWEDISTPAPNRWVTRIIASTHKDNRIYCTQNGYRQDEWTPYVWVSEDNGHTWTSISANLPFEPVNTIREDPRDEKVLYVGTDMGVYVSLDRGSSWLAYGSGIPNTPIHDIAIQDKAEEIVVASHARSVWAISTKPIHKLTKEVMEKEFHSFALDVPSGRDRWPYRRSPDFADDTYADQLVKTEIWSSVSGSGVLRLVDKEGTNVVSKKVEVVKGYNFLDLNLLLKPGDPKAPPVAGDPNDPKTALNDPYAARRAQYVAKGDYKLILEVGGKRFEQEVAVR